jgi:alpha-tubulin suppressor-like RCC1 family protein
LTGIVQVSAGGGFNLALRSDGTVWAWGDDGFGELGDGATNARRARFQHVPGLTRITQVSASSSESSFAVRADGTLFAWGNAANGQLGLGANTGTFLRVPSPTPVPGLTGVTQVSSGFFYTLALANQVTWGWGANFDGELGDRTETERDSPEQILFGPATQVVAGYLDSAVARPDGSLVVWGDGTLNPVVYTSLTGVTQVSLGQGINLVLGQSAFATVPNLTGDSTADASTELQAAGLVLGSQGSAVDTSCDNIGTVFQQSPAAGTTVRTGSAVSITIGTKPKTPCP